MSRPDYVPDDVENVLDHGGELGDSVSRSQAERNAGAIEDASQASGGANVYIPEGEFLIASQYSIGSVVFDGRLGAAGGSVYGAGPTETFLKVHPDHDDDEMTEVWYNGGDHGDVTWRGLTYDGNEALDSFTIGEGRQRGILFRDGSSASSIEFENFRMQHMMFNGIHIGRGYPAVSGTFERCTFYDIAIDLMKASGGSNIAHVFSGSGFVRSGEKMTVRDCEFRMVSGSIVDTNSPGDMEFHNCYSEGIGDNLLKAGNDLGTLTVRNYYHQGQTEELVEANQGLSTTFQGRHLFNRLNSGSGEQTIEMSNVEARNLVTSIANTGGGEFTIETHDDGGPIACHDIVTDSSAQFPWHPFRANGGSLSFDIDEISIHTVGDDHFDLDNGSGTIATLHRDSGSSLGDSDGVSISTDNDGGDPFSPDVPSRDEVGINSSGGGNTDEQDDESEDENEDTDDEVDDPLFEEWTPQWNSSSDDWSVVSDSEYEGDSALVFENDDGDRTLYGISWDAAGVHSDVEVLDRFRVPEFNPEDGLGFHARLHLRSSTVDGVRQGYWIEVEDREDAYRLGRYTADGRLRTLGRFGTPEENTFFYRRFRAEGDQLKAKVWPAGEEEPSDWGIELTDDAVSEGWVGLGSFDPGRVETDFISVATGGETAEFTEFGSSSSPEIAWENPADGETVSGTTTVQIDARNGDDSDEPLVVEYRVDDNSWSEATLNSETGYYEDSLDLSSLEEGEYRLEAEATDSEGNSSNETIGVVVEQTVSVSTLEARDVTESDTTLVGEVTSLGGNEEVEAGFELRGAGSDDWHKTETQTVTDTEEFVQEVTELESESEYEYRAIATASEQVTGDTRAFETSNSDDADEDEDNSELVIEEFDVTDRSRTEWNRYDVDWAVAHDGGDLDTAITKLRSNGMTVATDSTNISGETASFTHIVRVRGDVDEIRLAVNDVDNNVVSETKEL